MHDATLQPSPEPLLLTARPTIRYAIDANDRVTAADAALRALIPAGTPWPIAGRTAGLLFPTGDVRDLYRGLLACARAGRTVSVVQRFWDTPGQPRFVTELSPLPHGGVQFDLFALPAADPRADAEADTDDLLKVCAWCLDINVGRWLAADHAINRGGLLDLPRPRAVTHGICPACLEQVKREDPDY